MTGLKIVYCADVGSGGGSRHRDAIADGLRAIGHDVEVVHGLRGPVRARSGRGRTARGPARAAASFAALANSVLTTLVLARRLLTGRPDVLLWRPSLFGFHGLAAARIAGVPVVAEMNAPLEREARLSGRFALLGLARRIERAIVSNADAVVAVSRAVADACMGAVVVRNGGGFSTGAERRRAEAWGSDECPLCRRGGDTRYAVCLESFRAWHGEAERREAVAALPEGWRGVVIGDGPGFATFRRWLSRSGHARRVDALGALPPEAVQHVLAAHATMGFVLYRPLDDFWFSPLKLYDFLSHGVPVVATDLGQVGETGRDSDLVTLVAAGDARALRDAVRSVAARARRAAPSHDGEYGWRRAASGYARVLAAVTQPSRAPSLPQPAAARSGAA